MAALTEQKFKNDSSYQRSSARVDLRLLIDAAERNTRWRTFSCFSLDWYLMYQPASKVVSKWMQRFHPELGDEHEIRSSILATKKDPTIRGFRCLTLLTQSPAPWYLWAAGDFSPSPSSPSGRPTWDRVLVPSFAGRVWDGGAMATTLVPGADRFCNMICHISYVVSAHAHSSCSFWSCFGAGVHRFVASPNCNSPLTWCIRCCPHQLIRRILKLLEGSEPKAPQWLNQQKLDKQRHSRPANAGIKDRPWTFQWHPFVCSSFYYTAAPELLASFYSSGWLWPPSTPSGCVFA